MSSPAAESSLALVCHPVYSSPAIRALSAEASRLPDGALKLVYRLDGDISRLHLPPSRPACRSDRLWEHTCFEAFVAVIGERAYREFNFSPSGQWATYAFASYRQPDDNALATPAPHSNCVLSAGHLQLNVTVDPAALPPPGTGLHIGLSAVIESNDTQDGNRSYWALHHPLPTPDFHHRDGFTLELPVPHKNT